MNLELLPSNALQNIGSFLPSIKNFVSTSSTIYNKLGGENAAIHHAISSNLLINSGRYSQTASSIMPFVSYLLKISKISRNIIDLKWAEESNDIIFQKMENHMWIPEATEIDFSPFHAISSEKLLEICRKCPLVHSLTLGTNQRIKDEDLFGILQAMPYLTSLTIKNPSLLTAAGIEQLNQFPSLTSLSISRPLPNNITLLHITDFLVEQMPIDGQLPILPHLICLSIANSPDLGIIQNLPPFLQKLCIDGCGSNWGIIGRNIHAPIQIKTLTIRNCGDVMPRILASHIVVQELCMESCPTLQHFQLTRPQLTDVGRITTTVTIRDCSLMNQFTIDNSDIKNLHIENCDSLGAFWPDCPELTHLTLINCGLDSVALNRLTNLQVFHGIGLGKNKYGTNFWHLTFPDLLVEYFLEDCNNLGSVASEGNNLIRFSITSCDSLTFLATPSLQLQHATIFDTPYITVLDFASPNLRNLNLRLENLTKIQISACQFLETLSLNSCERPVTIEANHLWQPKSISLDNCHDLLGLPSSLSSLENLRIHNCNISLNSFNISTPRLHNLYLKGNIPLAVCQDILDQSPQVQHIFIQTNSTEYSSSAEIESRNLSLNNAHLKSATIEIPFLNRLLLGSLNHLEALSVASDAIHALDISGCLGLKTFHFKGKSEIQDSLPPLKLEFKSRELVTVSIKNVLLHESLNIPHLVKLKNLHIFDCKGLKTCTLPKSTVLENLTVELAPQQGLHLVFPSHINFSNLQTLQLLGCHLERIDLSSFHNLKTIIIEDSSLNWLNIAGLDKLESLALGMCRLSSITLNHLPRLQDVTLFINHLDNIELQTLPSLITLTVIRFHGQIKVNDCPQLSEFNCISSQIPQLDPTMLEQLETVTFESCWDVSSFPFHKAKTVTLKKCTLPSTFHLTNLPIETLTMDGCGAKTIHLNSLPSLTKLSLENETQLQLVRLENNPNLVILNRNLNHTIESLVVDNCPKFNICLNNIRDIIFRRRIPQAYYFPSLDTRIRRLRLDSSDVSAKLNFGSPLAIENLELINLITLEQFTLNNSSNIGITIRNCPHLQYPVIQAPQYTRVDADSFYQRFFLKHPRLSLHFNAGLNGIIQDIVVLAFFCFSAYGSLKILKFASLSPFSIKKIAFATFGSVAAGFLPFTIIEGLRSLKRDFRDYYSRLSNDQRMSSMWTLFLARHPNINQFVEGMHRHYQAGLVKVIASVALAIFINLLFKHFCKIIIPLFISIPKIYPPTRIVYIICGVSTILAVELAFIANLILAISSIAFAREIFNDYRRALR